MRLHPVAQGFRDEVRLLDGSTPGLLATLARRHPTYEPLSSIRALSARALQKRGMSGDRPDRETTDAGAIDPEDAADRTTSLTPARIVPGRLGAVTPSKDPIDRLKFNRVWNRV